MDNRSEIQQTAFGTLERNLYIYHFCKQREQDKDLYGAFAFLARKYSRSRERIRQIYRKTAMLMEGK